MSLKETQRMQAIRQAIFQLAATTARGTEFFDTAAAALAAGLAARLAGVCIRDGETDAAELIAFVQDGEKAPNFVYSLDDAPCAELYRPGDGDKERYEPRFIAADGIIEVPDDTPLAAVPLRGYAGAAFSDDQGRPIGHVFVADECPIAEGPDQRALVALVAARVGAEYTRWRAERRATLTNARLERAAELVNLGCWLWDDVADRALYCSDEHARIFGYESGKALVEVLDSPIAYLNRIHPDDRNRYRRDASRARKEKIPFRSEYRVLARDGRIRCVLEIAERRLDANGRLYRSGGILQDITEQIRARAALKETEARLEAIVDNTPSVIFLKDVSGAYSFVNKQFERLHRVPASWFLGKTAHDVFARDTAAIYEAHDRDVMQRRTPVVREQWTPSAEGPRLLEEVKFPVFDDNGDVIAIGMIGTDVTDRRKAEESEALMRSVLDASPIPIMMYRASDSSIVFETRASREVFGAPAAGAEQNVTSRWGQRADRERYEKLLRENKMIDGLEVKFRRPDQSMFWGSVSARLISFKGEDVVVASVFDLTERRDVEAQLARQREMLHQSEKLSAMGELLAGVSHELNNPLSVLVGQALMLREQAGDEATAARAVKIGEAAKRCAGIVRSFLAMARQNPRETRAVDVNEIIRSALDLTAYTLRASGIDVSTRLAPTLPDVMADPDQIAQVMTNLIMNAQQALSEVEPPRKLRITTAYRDDGEAVVIKVKDNGPGVPVELRGRIFEPLFTTKEVGTGTGIGLALCDRIVKGHGGSIAVEGPSGRGATFRVRLPAASADDRSRLAAEAEDRAHPAQRILVIDDEPDVAEILSDILNGDGHEVEIALSGAEALERIDEGQFDIVLSDIRMPGVDGPGLYKSLSDRRPEVIAGLAFITGDTLSSRVRDFLDRSGRPYIEKPITPKDVRGLIDRLCRARGAPPGGS